MKRFYILCLILACSSILTYKAWSEEKPLIYQVEIKKEISSTTWIYLKNGFLEANKLKAAALLIDMNTYGGLLEAADSMRTAILYSPIPVYVFINNNAASAGALISIACDGIYMREGASIGAATVVNQTGEAMPDKLLTLSDYEEPTEYFWDTEATGGIVVGEYLDYAWSGYMSEDEDIQILDPWGLIDQSTGEMMGMMFPVNNHPRKPIAGLEQSKYGAFAVPFYSITNPFNLEQIGFMNMWVWRMCGWSANNILVFGDLISNIQGDYEGQWIGITGTTLFVYEPDGMDGVYTYAVYISHNVNGNIFDSHTTYLYYGDYSKNW